ncbi:MAG: hypothetical protein AABY22_27505 [Nanoarchaeota archaeon]
MTSKNSLHPFCYGDLLKISLNQQDTKLKWMSSHFFIDEIKFDPECVMSNARTDMRFDKNFILAYYLCNNEKNINLFLIEQNKKVILEPSRNITFNDEYLNFFEKI